VQHSDYCMHIGTQNGSPSKVAMGDGWRLWYIYHCAPARTMPKSSVFIPSLSDLTSLKEELAILIARCVYTYNSISHTPKCMYMCTITCEKTNKYVCISLFRVLVQHMSCFKDQSKLVVTHIPSRHSKEMERKSEVVRTL